MPISRDVLRTHAGIMGYLAALTGLGGCVNNPGGCAGALTGTAVTAPLYAGFGVAFASLHVLMFDYTGAGEVLKEAVKIPSENVKSSCKSNDRQYPQPAPYWTSAPPPPPRTQNIPTPAPLPLKTDPLVTTSNEATVADANIHQVKLPEKVKLTEPDLPPPPSFSFGQRKPPDHPIIPPTPGAVTHSSAGTPADDDKPLPPLPLD